MKLPNMIKVNFGPHKITNFKRCVNKCVQCYFAEELHISFSKPNINFNWIVTFLMYKNDFIWLEHKALNAYVHVSFPSIAVLYWKFFNLQSRVKWVVIRCFSRRVCAAIPDSLQVVGVCTGNLQCTQNYLNRDLLWKLMFQYISINMPSTENLDRKTTSGCIANWGRFPVLFPVDSSKFKKNVI